MTNIPFLAANFPPHLFLHVHGEVDCGTTAERHCSVSRTGQMIRIRARSSPVHHSVCLQHDQRTLSSHHCAVSGLLLLHPPHSHSHTSLCSSTYCQAALIRRPLLLLSGCQTTQVYFQEHSRCCSCPLILN